jgi:hypothetical protein
LVIKVPFELVLPISTFLASGCSSPTKTIRSARCADLPHRPSRPAAEGAWARSNPRPYRDHGTLFVPQAQTREWRTMVADDSISEFGACYGAPAKAMPAIAASSWPWCVSILAIGKVSKRYCMYRLPGLIVDAHSPGRPWVPKHLGSPEHQLAHDL